MLLLVSIISACADPTSSQEITENQAEEQILTVDSLEVELWLNGTRVDSRQAEFLLDGDPLTLWEMPEGAGMLSRIELRLADSAYLRGLRWDSPDLEGALWRLRVDGQERVAEGLEIPLGGWCRSVELVLENACHPLLIPNREPGHYFDELLLESPLARVRVGGLALLGPEGQALPARAAAVGDSAGRQEGPPGLPIGKGFRTTKAGEQGRELIVRELVFEASGRFRLRNSWREGDAPHEARFEGQWRAEGQALRLEGLWRQDAAGQPAQADSLSLLAVPAKGKLDLGAVGVFYWEPSPDTFVDIEELSDGFALDMRYATQDNFLGIAVYDCPLCLLRWEVAQALLRANADFEALGLRIRLFDCYRPLSVQRQMWAVFPNPTYLANPDGAGSVHNRGGAVDLSLETLEGQPLDMGTDFDHFGPESRFAYAGLRPEFRANRDLLREVMERHGFRGITSEWWHFAYRLRPNLPQSDEPFDCP